jgi:GntR family transcriptional regulator/MocR family aminotransferase
MAKQGKSKGALLPLIKIDRSIGLPIYRQLETQIRRAVVSGQLRPGTRLPGSRVLAADLDVSRPVVMQAIEQLTAEGFIAAKRGSGTFVPQSLPRYLPQATEPRSLELPEWLIDRDPRRLSRPLSKLGVLFDSMTAPIQPLPAKPFLPNLPAYDLFPWAAWQKCRPRVSVDLLSYGDPLGYLPLRRSIADYLALHRGDRCEPEQIVITPGAHFTFMLTALLLANPGDRIWLEDPGPSTVRSLFKSMGLRIALVGSDASGMLVDEARRRSGEARLAFVMPSRHHPLGTTLSLPRRLALLDWARRQDAWIIEDDYDSEFRYTNQSLASVRSIDVAGRVIYVGTFSKALYSSLRLGYAVLPLSLVPVFRKALGLIARSVPGDVQAQLAAFIDRGHFATHMRRMRGLYGERREAFIAAAGDILGDCAEIAAPETGMNAIAWLPERTSDASIETAAARRDVQVYALSTYTARRPMRPGLILGFAAVSPQELRPRLRVLREVIGRRP